MGEKQQEKENALDCLGRILDFERRGWPGALGFRDMKLFSQALLAKQAWRLIERPDSLCARVLQAKYFPNGNKLETAFPTIQSPTWKAIVHELSKKEFTGILRMAGQFVYGARLGFLVVGPGGRVLKEHVLILAHYTGLFKQDPKEKENYKEV
jgi:hypothetical protein